jgi:YegS/Rv2252/BmrU family lipid kinase
MRRLPKQAILIVNTRSRRGATAFDEAVKGLRDAGVALIEAKPVEDPAQIQPAVREAVGNAPMVIVGGGDGTLSSTIDFFKGTDTVFALLPLGTANSFARALGFPLDLAEAIQAIATGVRRRIDLGCIDGDYFGNSAAIGLSPMIARTVPPDLKRYLGRAGYALWAVKVGAKFKPFKLTISDGRTRDDMWASEVRIANGGYFGGVELVEDAELDSGEIIVEVVVTKTRRHLFASWVASALRLRNREEGKVEFRGHKLRLDTEPVMDVTIDGELAKKTPITVWVARHAVDVAVPEPGPTA